MLLLFCLLLPLQVCGVSLVLAGLSYPLSRFWYTRNWRRISENELFEQKMLRWVAAVGLPKLLLWGLSMCCYDSLLFLGAGRLLLQYFNVAVDVNVQDSWWAQHQR
jgi:hypothetical protein